LKPAEAYWSVPDHAGRGDNQSLENRRWN